MALRFAVSALWETVAALRVLSRGSPVNRRWAALAEQRLLDVDEDLSLLYLLVGMAIVPEFLMPTPTARSVDIDTEIAALARTTPEQVAAAAGENPHTRTLADNPAKALTTLQKSLRTTHDAIIAPVWPRLAAVLHADVESRGRRLIDAGGPAVLAELHPSVSFRNPAIEVCNTRAEIGERDVVLVPSAFVWPNVYLRDNPTALAVCYPARGFGALAERVDAPITPALARLIGATRAKLLSELERPCTVSELAARLDVTVGAVSQHLGVLRAAGLVVSRRDGRGVLSARTRLGLALVEGEVG